MVGGGTQMNINFNHMPLIQSSQNLTCSLLSDVHIHKKSVLHIIFKFGVEECWSVNSKGGTARGIHLVAEQSNISLKHKQKENPPLEERSHRP